MKFYSYSWRNAEDLGKTQGPKLVFLIFEFIALPVMQGQDTQIPE